MIINDLDGYYIVFDTKNWNTELDTLPNIVHLNPKVESMVWAKRASNCSIIEKIPPKGVSFSDFICIFAMSY